MLHVLVLVGCAAAIYVSCEWFVNAVEWLGQRLRVGRMAVGSILAAVGTALPESVVTFVAVVFGDSETDDDIGVGAAMGGPLVLATIAYGVTGWTLLARKRRTPAPHGEAAHTGRLARDQTWFLVVFVVKVTLGLVAFAVKPWLGFAFFAVYGLYFWREMRGTGSDDNAGQEGDAADGHALAPLFLQHRRSRPATWAVVVQTLGALVIIFVASELFVHQLEAVGAMLGLPATVTALLLSPVATELPETVNAIIWVRQGKTPLALANISGAMMIQATVPSGLGLLGTPWRFDTALLISGVATIVAIVYLLALLRTRRINATSLALTTAIYAAFAAVLLVVLV